MKPDKNEAESAFEQWQLSMAEDCRSKQHAVPFRAGYYAAVKALTPPPNIDDLRRCPFCGSEAKYGEVSEGENFGGEFIECTNPMCGCSTHLKFPVMQSVKEDLADIWNNRKP